MAATKLGQYKRALRAIGDQRLNSLDENSAARHSLDDVWTDSIAHMLRLGNWKFALRVVQIGVDPDVTPSFGPQYGFTIPDDLMRLAGISIDPGFQEELFNYDEHDGHWWTNAGPTIYARFVSDRDDKGGDLGQWPVDFAEAHALYMAWDSGLQITKARTTRDALYAEHERALFRSMKLDAIGQAVKRKPQGSWVRSRFSGGLSGNRDGGFNN